jgi:hypothetical protein
LKEVIYRELRGLGHLSDLGAINKGLGALMHKLHAWGKEKFGNITRELVRLRERLLELHTNNAPSDEIRAVNDLMNEILYREEMLYFQRPVLIGRRRGITIQNSSISMQFGGLVRIKSPN